MKRCAVDRLPQEPGDVAQLRPPVAVGAPPGASCTTYLPTMPASRCGPVWQWNSHVPAASGTMSATSMPIGNNPTTSVRMWLAITVLPCQCGACISKFVEPNNVEHKLYEAIIDAHRREEQAREKRDYAAVFESLERLRPTVAAFFDKGGVMVMDPTPELRDNRLALLNWFISPYLAIADFRLLAGAA